MSGSRRGIAIGGTFAVFAVLTGTTLTGFAPIQPTVHETPSLVTFAAAGDSITAWAGSAGPILPVTWATLTSGRATFTGQGWANAGATTADIAANIKPVTADVLVIMAGTNDLGVNKLGTPMADRLVALDLIAANSHATRIIISAVAPFNGDPDKSTGYNAVLKLHAAEQGWGFVDSWASCRGDDGRYLPEDTIDGYHPTTDCERMVAAIIGPAIVAAVPDEVVPELKH